MCRARVALFGLVSVAALAVTMPAFAEERQVFVIEIKDHRFSPDTVEIPANTKVVLEVRNLDRTPEEFESYEMNREVIIGGGRTAKVNIGPLKPGNYPFFGEFNMDTAKGTLVAK